MVPRVRGVGLVLGIFGCVQVINLRIIIIPRRHLDRFRSFQEDFASYGRVSATTRCGGGKGFSLMVRPCHCSLCGNKLDEPYGPPPWGAAFREQVSVPFSVRSRLASPICYHKTNVSCNKYQKRKASGGPYRSVRRRNLKDKRRYKKEGRAWRTICGQVMRRKINSGVMPQEMPASI